MIWNNRLCAKIFSLKFPVLFVMSPTKNKTQVMKFVLFVLEGKQWYSVQINLWKLRCEHFSYMIFNCQLINYIQVVYNVFKHNIIFSVYGCNSLNELKYGCYKSWVKVITHECIHLWPEYKELWVCSLTTVNSNWLWPEHSELQALIDFWVQVLLSLSSLIVPRLRSQIGLIVFRLQP